MNEDRLGSTVKHFPYGEEPTTTGQDRVKFATYYRDETTTLDYADQRYYLRTISRFLTADPYRASAGPADPQSWNRYAYVQGDPVNFNDPQGLMYNLVVGGHCDAFGLCRAEAGGFGFGYSLFDVPDAEDSFNPSDFWSDMYRRDDSGSERMEESQGGQHQYTIDATANRLARGRLDTRLRSWDTSHCRRVLNMGRQTLLGAVQRVNFYDARVESDYGSLRQRDVVDNSVDSTLANSRNFGAWATTIMGETRVAVALYANFYSASPVQQQNTLLHEMLHAIGWTHDTLVSTFGSEGLRGVFDISDWLERDCGPVKR